MDLQQLSDVSIVAGAVLAVAIWGWLADVFRRRRQDRRFVRRVRKVAR